MRAPGTLLRGAALAALLLLLLAHAAPAHANAPNAARSAQTGGAAGDATAAAGPFFNVRASPFGARGDGRTDDTQAVARAVAALNAAGGGTLFFPKGRYKTSGGFQINVPANVVGEGTSDPYLGEAYVSRVDCTSPTAALFTVTAAHALFRDIALVNTSPTPPTAGAGIVASHPTLSYNRVDYDHITVVGFYDDIDSRSGAAWSMRASFLGSPVRYGIRIRNLVNPDAGDWSISDSVISQSVHAGEAAIRQESSGGGKITNVKINGGGGPDTALFLNGIDAAASGTSILQVTNSSIENVRGRGISIVGPATGFAYVTLNNLEFGLYRNRSPNGNAIYFENVVDSLVDNVVAVSDGPGAPAVLLRNCARIKIGALHAHGFNPYVAYAGTYTEEGYRISNGYNAPALANGWANLGGGYAAAGYGMVNGRVEVHGTVQAGRAGSTIFTLPTGYRPSATLIFATFSGGTHTWVEVRPNGDVVHCGGTARCDNSSQTLNFSFAPF